MAMSGNFAPSRAPRGAQILRRSLYVDFAGGAWCLFLPEGGSVNVVSTPTAFAGVRFLEVQDLEPPRSERQIAGSLNEPLHMADSGQS